MSLWRGSSSSARERMGSRPRGWASGQRRSSDARGGSSWAGRGGGGGAAGAGGAPPGGGGPPGAGGGRGGAAQVGAVQAGAAAMAYHAGADILRGDGGKGILLDDKLQQEGAWQGGASAHPWRAQWTTAQSVLAGNSGMEAHLAPLCGTALTEAEKAQAWISQAQPVGGGGRGGGGGARRLCWSDGKGQPNISGNNFGLRALRNSPMTAKHSAARRTHPTQSVRWGK